MKSLLSVCLFFCFIAAAISAEVNTCSGLFIQPCTRKIPCPYYQYCDGLFCCGSKKGPHNGIQKALVPICPPDCWQCSNDETACCCTGDSVG
uniref:Uncharacterized protein n=1 Tax=Panagrolaimus sp. ES5 TaxID=591445 RepID=A0AC34FAM4_9BILA